MKRTLISGLLILLLVGLAGCQGDTDDGLDYDFEGLWRFTYTVTANAGGYPAPVGGQFSELVRIREEDDTLSLTFENHVILEGSGDRYDGTFDVFDSGTTTPEPPADPIDWEIGYRGAAVDERTMRGTSSFVVGSAVSTADWVAERLAE